VREILVNGFVKGKVIEFGEYEWRILDIKDKKALIITDEIIEKRRLDEKSSIRASSEIRKYLNGDFYNKFTPTDRSKIIIQNNRTKKISKSECSADACEYTDDHIFCLSYEEAYIYFSDCTKKLEKVEKIAKRDKYNWYIEDENSILRQAKFEGKNFTWWLRSPSYDGSTTARVLSNGCIRILVKHIRHDFIAVHGIRPALWLNIEN
jgi:hypothetical protein